MDPETQQQQEEPMMPEEAEKKPRRGSRVSKMTSQAAKHVARKAANTGRDFFYQTTLEERVIILASIVAIILSFLPWAAAITGSTVIELSGVTSFLYMMGILVVASALMALWSIIWVLMERPLPRFIDNPAKLHVLLGIQITQIGLIAYTMFQASFTLTQDLEAKTSTLLALIICGLAMIGAGIFEQNKRERKRTSTTILPTHHHIHDHEQSDAELESILGGENKE